MRLLPLLLLLAALAGPARAAAPVVVELFTSQGCSSCPPADALLRDLSRDRPDVLALAFHVTYWDSLGWRDPFSLPAATARQRAHARSLQLGAIYTPQMVVNGRLDVVGSDSAAVLAAIGQAARDQPAAALTLSPAEGGLSIDIRPLPGAPAEARLWLVGYDSLHRTAVGRGENGGRTLAEANIVRDLQDLGPWRGFPLHLTHGLPAGEHSALLLQAADGRIIAAAVSGG